MLGQLMEEDLGLSGMTEQMSVLYDKIGKYEGVPGHYEGANAWMKDNPAEQEITEDLE